jgi:hypothetical protein
VTVDQTFEAEAAAWEEAARATQRAQSFLSEVAAGLGGAQDPTDSDNQDRELIIEAVIAEADEQGGPYDAKLPESAWDAIVAAYTRAFAASDLAEGGTDDPAQAAQAARDAAAAWTAAAEATERACGQ